MHDRVNDISEILGARARELDGVARPISASFAVHVGLLLTLALLPSSWFAIKTPEKLMVITLGAGAVGPNPNGLTPIGGKKVEQVAPPTARPEPIIPTAPKPTAVTEPIKAPVKPPVKPSNATPQPQTMPTTKPSTGAQITPGNAVAATSATGLGVGLSSGGQGGSSLDSNFCCPEWANTMRERVYWNQSQGITGDVVIQFVVERDGTIKDIQLQKKSGYQQLDIDAQRAVMTAKLPPLPPAYLPNRLTITLTFPYIR